MQEMTTKPVLPDFCRIQWAGTTERQWFKSQFDEATEAFKNVERLSVLRNYRRAAYQAFTIEELPSITYWATQNDLVVLPVYLTGPMGNYTTTATAGKETVRVVITRPEYAKHALPWVDDEKIGEWLGFPQCCRKAFAETWGQKQVDSTWEQMQSPLIQNWYYGNSLLRSFGIRLVPHMPCSLNCERSITFGRDLFNLGVKEGYAEEMEFIRMVLQWPIAWNRLFGIAEIITPAVKATVRSDWTPDKQQWSTTAGQYVRPQESWWTDNGFKNPTAMRHAHKILIQAIQSVVGDRPLAICDLGCGNGLLMRRFAKQFQHAHIGGIDINANAIAAAKKYLSGTWVHGRIEEAFIHPFAQEFNTVLINPARLPEMPEQDAEWLRGALQNFTTIIYTYGDHVLADVAAKAKLTYSPVCQSPLVNAGVVQWSK